MSTVTPQGLRSDLPERPKLPRYCPSVVNAMTLCSFLSVTKLYHVIGVDTDANRVYISPINNGVEIFIMFVFDQMQKQIKANTCTNRNGNKPFGKKGLIIMVWTPVSLQ